MIGRIGRAAGLVAGLVERQAVHGSAVVGELRTERRSVELGGAEAVRAEIRMGVGELRVHGGAAHLLDGTFTYNVEGWRPEIRYSAVPGADGRTTGSLLVAQPPGLKPANNTRCAWDLALRDGVPMTLHVELGVGQSELRLGSLTLSKLRVEAGVGECTVDLSGAWDADLEAVLTGGVGRLTLRLPREIGVRVRAKTGLGSTDAHGLIRCGDAWVNEACGRTQATLTVTAEAGIGEVSLRADGISGA